jgi:hypothetical protein
MSQSNGDLETALFGCSIVRQDQLCEVLNVLPTTVRQWGVPSCRIGGTTIYKTDDLREFLNARFSQRRVRKAAANGSRKVSVPALEPISHEPQRGPGRPPKNRSAGALPIPPPLS